MQSRYLSGLAVALATFALATAISISQWRTLAAPSWDLGIFTQLADAYAHLRAPIVPIKGDGYNLLGDHFHPILVLLAPFYRLAPSGLTLLIVQNALFALAAGAFATRLARLIPLWAATCLGAILGLGWATQTAVAAQFHEIAFAVPLLAFALTAYLADRPVAAAAWMAPLVFVKEDLGLTVAALGVIMLVRSFRSAGAMRRAGIFLIGWGAAWFLLAITVLLPALNPHGQYDYTGRLDETGSILAPATKWLLLAFLILTAGIIGAASPLILLILPTLAWRFAGNVEFYWWIGWHYDVILMPILLAALVDAARRLGPRYRDVRTNAPVTTQLLAAGIALSISSTVIVGATLPIFANRTVEPARVATAQQIEELVSGDVVSDLTLMARLVPHARVYWVAERDISPNFVVIDQRSSEFSRSIADVAAWAEQTYGGSYRVVLSDNGFQVAERAH